MRPYNKAELADDLLLLNHKAIESKADISEWNALAAGVGERLLLSDTANLDPLPDALNDYLADGGLHSTDPESAADHRSANRAAETGEQGGTCCG